MAFFQFKQKSFFASVLDYIFQIFSPRENDCPVTEAGLASFKSIYKTRFTPSPAYSDSAIFRTSFYAPLPIQRAHSETDDLFETSFTPTPCARRDTFATRFYSDSLNMPYRRQAKDCRKKEYDYGYKPFFNAVSPSDGAFCAPGILQSFKNWYGGGGLSAPSAPSIVSEPDSDCNCSEGSPLMAKLLLLQRSLMCSPVARAVLALLAARGVLYMMGVRVCFVKVV